MGVDLAAQADALWRALLLGAACAFLYDLLRAVRLLRRTQRWLTAALDLLYVFALVLALTAFTLRVGGELRLYMLLAVFLGAAAVFAFLSPLLRPLWAFWVSILSELLRLAAFPLRAAKKYLHRGQKLTKKLFLFSRHSLIIKNYKWSARHARRRTEREEGIRYGRKKSGKKK